MIKKRLLFLLCAFLIGFFMVSVLSSILVYKFGADSTPAMRILTVLQDILLFIAPAIATAMISTRMPASLLCIDKRPPLMPLLMALCVLLVSVPAMNQVIWLNEQLPLPEGLAQSLRSMEEQAGAMVATLQGPHTVPNLIMSILIVGIMAGVSEELLFRGALQRLLSTGGYSVHTAIWVSAFLFSLLHMQFYGFVPRMLLGAFFGYTLYWTGSLWVPIILHTANNTMYLVAQWISNAPEGESPLDSLGQGSDYLYAILSLILTALGLYLLSKEAPKPPKV